MKTFLSILVIFVGLFLAALGLLSWLDRLGIRKIDSVDPFGFAHPNVGHLVLFAVILAFAIGIWKFFYRVEMIYLKEQKVRKERLVGLLHSVAMYNDKGYIWMNDSPEKSDSLRKEWRQEIDGLILKIGKKNFPPEILQMLQSPDLILDWSGRYVEKIEAWVHLEQSK